MGKRKRLSPKQRRRKLLKDAPENMQFWLKTGIPIKNVVELANAFEQMEHDTYYHHANEQKNDFSSWVKEVLDEKTLARDLQTAKSKQEAHTLTLKHLVKNLS